MTITSLVLRSKYSEKPLAQIITSGGKFDVTADNTGGTLDKLDNDLSKLQDYVHRSSHLTLEQSDDAIPTFLRFLLETGDVLEVTEDGSVALLNGEFLSPEEQQSMADQIASGQVKAVGEASKYQAVPQPPATAPKQPLPDPSRWIYMATGKAEARQKKRQEQDEQSSKYYDDVIEGAKFDTIDPEFTKNLAYGFQYGTVGKGGEDA